MALIEQSEIIGLLTSLETAISNQKKTGNPPPPFDGHTAGTPYYTNQITDYKKTSFNAAFNAASVALAQAIKSVEAWMPELLLKALNDGEVLIAEAPSTNAARKVDFLLLDKRAGKYRIFRGGTQKEVQDAHKNTAS